MLLRGLLALLLAVGAPRRAACCVLQGQDSGHCVPTAGIAALLPFCAPYVSLYPSACLPNEYPNFPNHTALHKDAWVKAQVELVVARRLAIEDTNGQGFTLRAFEGVGGVGGTLRAGGWGAGPAVLGVLLFPRGRPTSHLLPPYLPPPRSSPPHARAQCPTRALRARCWCTF